MPGEASGRPKTGVFKEELDAGPVAALCTRVTQRISSINSESLRRSATLDLDALALKQRVAQVADALRAHLDPDGPTMLRQLVAIADADPNDPVSPERLSGFLAWPVIAVVERHGLPWPSESLEALEQLTSTFSAEFAVRPFLRDHPELTLAVFHEWTRHPDEHVRRLVSEGSRPRLPWGARLRAFQADPRPTIALLEALQHDPALYVRRSVANHLNDIARDHPDLCVSTLHAWNVDPGEYTAWITRHALRSLVKDGHPGALALQGFAPPQVRVLGLSALPSVLTLGGALELRAELLSEVAQDLVLDFVVGFVKANGRRAPKVFKWSRTRMEAGERRTFDKSLPVRPISTRRYYAGEHTVQLRINGQDLGPEVRWTLELEPSDPGAP